MPTTSPSPSTTSFLECASATASLLHESNVFRSARGFFKRPRRSYFFFSAAALGKALLCCYLAGEGKRMHVDKQGRSSSSSIWKRGLLLLLRPKYGSLRIDYSKALFMERCPPRVLCSCRAVKAITDYYATCSSVLRMEIRFDKA